MMLISGVNF